MKFEELSKENYRTFKSFPKKILELSRIKNALINKENLINFLTHAYNFRLLSMEITKDPEPGLITRIRIKPGLNYPEPGKCKH